MSTDDMMRHKITDEGVSLMRDRVGYSNPTVRSGTRQLPWWTVTSQDAIRHFVNGYGDDNPLYVDPDYGPKTRWGAQIAPPGFVAAGGPHAHREPLTKPEGDAENVRPGDEEDTWFKRLGRTIPDDFHERTRRALRGIQLYSSGIDNYYYRPYYVGDYAAGSAGGVHSVDEKESEFAGKSVIVGNQSFSWNQRGEVMDLGRNWFVHAERRKAKSSKSKKPAPTHALYTDEELQRIEKIYDGERARGSDTFWYEDVEVGSALPEMVKGPLHLTDMWNQHMGAGWFGYGNPALRLGYENRKKMSGFYSRTKYNSWDVIQRVHWDEALAQEVGVPLMYDIAPTRNAWVLHYCTQVMGDDAWLYHVHNELRSFNFFGDTTFYSGEVREKRVDAELGPLMEISISGINQRGVENTTATAIILLASKEFGAVKLPSPPDRITEKTRQLHWERGQQQK